ncbi:hypothetical protein [Phaeodactylibacter luteus]|uniref:hypothetical protein n=1 Tax=Phaeodactylibacter luteus TaxID=1564516 RepID=UPI001B87FB9C|nr:hypothetical protein [Phaeodactylibacter luteus]
MDFINIIRNAWAAYDPSRPIDRVSDISAMVSTNHVFKIRLADKQNIIAKLSYFGAFEHFVEDHTIINALSNNLPVRYENFLSRALMKGHRLFVHRHKTDELDVWVVFYRPIRIRNRMPRRLSGEHIDQLAVEFAKFHKSCHLIRHTLPLSSKNMTTDINELARKASQYGPYRDEILRQCDTFLYNTYSINANGFDIIPVFVDWNIGNFSVTATGRFFSRWDYDWFRMSSRVADFYFISRVVSHAGDQSAFTYNASTLMEPRFLRFLKKYHEVHPLSFEEVLFIKEAYRFFLLNYVIKEGHNFFLQSFATQLQRDAFEAHLPTIDQAVQAEQLARALHLS